MPSNFPNVNRFPFKVFTVSKNVVRSGDSFNYAKSAPAPVPGTVYWEEDEVIQDDGIVSPRSVRWGENTYYDDVEKRDGDNERVAKMLERLQISSTRERNTSCMALHTSDDPSQQEGDEERREPIEFGETRRELFSTDDESLQDSDEKSTIDIPSPPSILRYAKTTSQEPYEEESRKDQDNFSRKSKDNRTSCKHQQSPARRSYQYLQQNGFHNEPPDELTSSSSSSSSTKSLNRHEFLYNLSQIMQADGKERREAIAKASFERRRIPHPEEFGKLPLSRATDMYERGMAFLRSKQSRLEKKREDETEQILANYRFKLARRTFKTPLSGGVTTSSRTSWKSYTVPCNKANDLYHESMESIKFKQAAIAQRIALRQMKI